MDNNIFWTILISGIVGFIIGLFVMWIVLRNKGKDKQQYQALLKRFGGYRDEVDRHFIDTAEAVDDLNKSYQKVVDHLSEGAQNLMQKEALKAQLTHRQNKSFTFSYLTHGKEALDHDMAINDEDVPAPLYTDATRAEVVPDLGQPDRVADRVGKNASKEAKEAKSLFNSTDSEK